MTEEKHEKEGRKITARIYVRLSDYSRTSIQSQIRDCREYCEKHRFAVDHVYNDGMGQSGWDETRDGYEQMLTDAEAGEFDVLVVRRGHRIGRDKRERIRRFLDLDEWGVEFHTCKRGYVDPDDPGSFLMEVFQATHDDHGKRDESELLQAEMKRRRENGYYIGEQPAGLAYDDTKEHLTKGSEFEQALRVFGLRDEGCTYAEIAEQVPWSEPTVGKILKRREEYEAVSQGAKLGYELRIVVPDNGDSTVGESNTAD